MTKIAYLECPTGIAGDMCLGALIEAGVPLAYLIEKLNLLNIADEYALRQAKVSKNGQVATKVYVDLLKSPGHQEKPTFAADDPDLDHAHHHAHHHHHHDHDQTAIGQQNPDTEPGTERSRSVVLPFDFAQEPRSSTLSEVEVFPSTSLRVKVEERSRSEELTHLPHRHLPEIRAMITQANLPERVEKWSLQIFQLLAEAEGLVHGVAPEQVHFHEVGAIDAIIDIVGTCLGLDWLGIEKLYCSALPTGGGTVKASHGEMPVPTPAVLKLWEMRQIPVYHNGINKELCTPTGSAIACALAQSFGPPPKMMMQKIGLGAGTRDLPIPNVLRLWLGEQVINSDEVNHNQESITVLETQIDDLTPQAIAFVFDALFSVGALDVFTQPIVMKKSRLGVLLTVICHPENSQACEAVIFRETTTLGIRRSNQTRTILEREIQAVETKYGKVRVKIAKIGSTINNIQPEYEDCAEIARKNQLSWREVHQLAYQSWYENP